MPKPFSSLSAKFSSIDESEVLRSISGKKLNATINSFDDQQFRRTTVSMINRFDELADLMNWPI